MLGFANLDPVIITSFWIYLIASFAIGFAGGWVIKHRLTKIAFENFCSEKKSFEAERASLMETKEKYVSLCKDLEKNEKYWLYKQKTKQETSEYPSDDPSKLLYNELNSR
jgi:hypothetical protein